MRLLAIALLTAVLAACAAPAAQSPTVAPATPVATQPAPTATAPTATAPTGTALPSPAAPAADLPAALGYGQAVSSAFVPGADLLAVGTTAGVLLLGLPGLAVDRFIALDAAAYEIAASPDGQHLAVSGFDGPVRGTRLLGRDGSERFAVRGGAPFFSADGALLAVADLDDSTGRYTTRLHRVSDGAEVGAAPGDRARLSPGAGVIAAFDQSELVLTTAGGAELLRTPAYAVAFSPDTRALAFSGFAGVELLGLSDGALDQADRRTLTQEPAQDLVFTQDGALLAVTQSGILRWDLAAGGEPLATPLDLGPNMASFSPDGALVALNALVGDGPSTLRVVRSGDASEAYADAQFEGGDASFGPDGQLAVVTDAGQVRLVAPEGGVTAERRLAGYSRVAFAEDGTVAAGRSGPQVDLWRLDGGEEPAQVLGGVDFTQRLRELSAVPGGTMVGEVEQQMLGGYVARLAAISFPPATQVAPQGGDTEVAGLTLEMPAVWDAAGGLIAWAGPGGEILLSDEGGEPSALPQLRGAPVGVAPTSMAFSPDGRRLAVGFAEGSFLIVDVPAQLPLGAGPIGGGEAITAIAWSADGMFIAYALAGGDVLVGEALDDDPLRRISGAPRAEFGGPRMALSADGGLLAVGAPPGVALFRRADGAELARHPGRAEDVALSPDGGVLAAVVGGRVVLWPVGE